MKSRHLIPGLHLSLLAVGLAAVLYAPQGQTHEAGDFLLKGGVTWVSPKSNNGSVADGTVKLDVGNNARPSFSLTYMATRNIGIELLGAFPFQHNIDSNLGRIGKTKHLPPTLSLQYHFLPDSDFQPYVGVGVNYTLFFDEDTKGALSGADLELDDSWGLAAQAGMDFDVAPNWFLNVDVRYIDIDAKAKLDGVGIGTVEIDPWIVGFNVGTRF